MNSLKLIIPIIIVFILIGAAAYSIYKTQTVLETTPNTAQDSFPSPTPSASPQVKSANAPANQPATGPSDELAINNIGIQVNTPINLATITSPVSVSGSANVTSQIVKISIKDSNGNILGSGQATACVGINACNYTASIPFSNPSTPTGSIDVYSPSTLDDSKTFSHSIPVSF